MNLNYIYYILLILFNFIKKITILYDFIKNRKNIKNIENIENIKENNNTDVFEEIKKDIDDDINNLDVCISEKLNFSN